LPEILLVEDDAALAKGVARAIAAEGRHITICGTLGAARRALERPADLILLDIGLPDGNGLTLCKELRLTSRMPVIFLTANDTEEDEIAGFCAGGDDYITKPFRLSVLRARVDAALRRAGCEDVLLIDGFRFDFAHADFSRDGKQISLSRSEQKLLYALVSARGRIVPRETLLDRIWTDGLEYVDENALSVTVRRLRQKLGKAYIQTVYGVGYRWENANA
jgi:DNA-binding response OmpR family regulator